MEDIKIIDNYRSLPLGDYQDIVAIDKDKTLDEVDRQVKILSILTGMDEDSILDLPIFEFKALAAKLAFLEVLPTDNPRPAKTIVVGKFELEAVTDMRKVTTAQYIDFQSFHQLGVEEHLVEILSCLLVPKGKRYNQDYDIIEVQDAIRKDLNVFDAASLYGFFMISCKESIKDMLTYSLQEAKKIPDQRKREEVMMQIQRQQILLETSGVG